MVYGRYLDTIAGRMYLAVEGERVVRLTGGTAADGDVIIDSAAELSCRMKTAAMAMEALDLAVGEVLEYLDGRRREFDVPVYAKGTPFQEKVWNALREIPYGEIRTYGEIAKAVGSPRGARAVGMACNRNPVMLFIPCHRVVGSTGGLVGFAGGLEMKKWLLELEKAGRRK